MSSTWITSPDDERLPDLWPGYVDMNDVVLTMVLEAAREDCEAYGPKLDDPDAPPARYVLAQAQHARAIARAGFVGSSDQEGGYGETVTVYPMDWHVKQLLRPKKGVPSPA